MATVEELLVRISANTEQLQRELKRAESATSQSTKRMQDSLDKFDRQAEKLGSTLKNAFGLFGIGLGVGELINFGKRALEAGAGLGELAEQLGVSTDALQVYQFAAVQSGVSTQELEAGLMKLTRSIGAALDGDQKAINAFRAMGVSLLDAKGAALGTDPVFQQIAQRYQEAGNKAQFLANAADVGGRSFQRLAPLLAGGADQLGAWEEAARKAGIILEKELIERLDRASDRINAFWFSFERRATIGIAGVIGAFDDLDLRKAEKELAGVNQQLQLLAKNGGSATLIKSFQDQKRVLEDYIATLKKAAQVPPAAPGGIGIDEDQFGPKGGKPRLPNSLFDKEIDQRIASLKAERSEVGLSTREQTISKAVRELEAQAVAKQTTVSADRIAKLREEIGLLYDANAAEQARADIIKRFTAEQQAERDFTDKRSAQVEAAPKIVNFEVGQETADLERRTKAADQGNKALQTENALIEIRNKFRGEGISLTDTELEQYRTQAERLGELRDKLDRAEDSMRDLRQAGNDLGHAIGTAFEDAVVKGGSLRDVLLGLYQDINRIILRITVTKPLERALTDWLDSGSGSSGGGGFSGMFGDPNAVGRSGGAYSWLGDLFGGGAGTADSYGIAEFAPAMAAGGRPTPGMPHLVGEKGAELFVPDVAGTIVPNDNLRGMLSRGGSDGGVHIGQIVIQGPVNDKSMTELKREIATASAAGRRR